MRRKSKGLMTILAAVLTVAILYAGQSMWQQYVVVKPLDKLVYTIQGVENVQIDDKVSQLTLAVTLKDVTNLPQVYTKLLQATKDIAGSKKMTIMIHDNRSPELERFYTSIHYYVQEAIVTGHFGTMAETIQAQAQSQAVTANVWVDSKYIYLQFTQNGAQLYEIIARQTGEVK